MSSLDNLTSSYISEIARRLKNPRENGGASLMIGAGFSRNAVHNGSEVKMPSWPELAERMYEALYPAPKDNPEKLRKWKEKKLIKTAERNITKLAEEYLAGFDRMSMNHLIEAEINDKAYSPSELHKKLLSLKWMDVFTTNYDTLLERASERVFRENSYRIVKTAKDLPGSTRPRIIKLHGSIPDVKPYIITDEDYRKYPHTHPAFVNTVQQAMLETRLCLIGFSGEDPNFLNWLGWLRDNMEEDWLSIYLIGMFDSLSETEKALMSSRGITIVDISALSENQSVNGHYEAFSRFIDMLSVFQQSEDFFRERPYKDSVRTFWKPDNPRDYSTGLLIFSKKLYSQLSPYVILPIKQQSEIGDYYCWQFRTILSDSQLCKELALVAAVIRMLRRCNIVLEDHHAVKLELLLGEVQKKKSISAEERKDAIDTTLYLLEMYRVDGNREKHELLYEKAVGLRPETNQLNELLIEQSKLLISCLEFARATETVKEIKSDSFIQNIKKAGLLKQLKKKEEADSILRACAQKLAQMHIPDDLYDSYIGYLNLCYKWDNFEIEEQFSDRKRYSELYNTRRVMTEMRDELMKILYEESEKRTSTGTPSVFLNASSRTATLKYGRNLFLETFRYLLAIDKLSLPVFYDQAQMLPRILEEIDESSPYKLWRLSLAIRCNDPKTVDRIMSRERIMSTDPKEIQQLFEKIVDDAFGQRGARVFAQKTAIDVAAVLALFLEDRYVADFLQAAIPSVTKEEHLEFTHLQTAINRLAVRFNPRIAETVLDLVFGEEAANYYLASFFDDIRIVFSDTGTDELYRKVLERLKSDDMRERDNAVSQLILLWNNNQKPEYEQEIVNCIWGVDTDILPETERFLPIIWERLPVPKEADFGMMYKERALEYELIRAVENRETFLGNNSTGSVRDYFNYCYYISEISPVKVHKVAFDSIFVSKMLDKIEDFFNNEKAILVEKMEQAFGGVFSKTKFNVLAQHVALIMSITFAGGTYATIEERCSILSQEMEQCGVTVSAVQIVKTAIDSGYEAGFREFENELTECDGAIYRSVFFGLHCLLYLVEKQCQDIHPVINGTMRLVFQYIKQSGVEKANAIWLHMSGILEREAFRDEEWMDEVEQTARYSIQEYLHQARNGSRNYSDALYNCVNALSRYVNKCEERGVLLSEKMRELITMASKTTIYEVDNIWIRNK